MAESQRRNRIVYEITTPESQRRNQPRDQQHHRHRSRHEKDNRHRRYSEHEKNDSHVKFSQQQKPFQQGSQSQQLHHLEAQSSDDVNAWGTHIALTTASHDIAGLRQLILDNAVIGFPRIVSKYREHFHYGPATDAFRISVIPLYEHLPDKEIIFDYFLAILAYKPPHDTVHTHLAMSYKCKDIPTALHCLLVVLGDSLTQGEVHGHLLTYKAGSTIYDTPFAGDLGGMNSEEMLTGGQYKGHSAGKGDIAACRPSTRRPYGFPYCTRHD